ncbi:hypothetical protein CL614_06500 [archaeon]|nr:hypothetical protein [archaeon]|tara:strand:+ start:1058 stop:1402 length:345 start_codon:yes stop_codon:yes gene_type:complete
MLPKIQKVEFGKITIDGEEHKENDIVLFWDGVEKKDKSHHIELEHFQDLLLKDPDTVIFGTGFNDAVKIDSRILHEAQKEGTEVVIKKTPKALDMFKELSHQGKKVIAIIHITC